MLDGQIGPDEKTGSRGSDNVQISGETGILGLGLQ